MGDIINFLERDLEHYLLVEFACGRAFAPKWGGRITEQSEMDFQGHPALYGPFADHMDKTSYNLVVPYARFEAIYNAMYRPEPATYQDQRMNYLHKTWSWWSFERRSGVTVEKFAERMQVAERTVGRWKGQLFRYIEKELTAPAAPLVYPATYHLQAAQG